MYWFTRKISICATYLTLDATVTSTVAIIAGFLAYMVIEGQTSDDDLTTIIGG